MLCPDRDLGGGRRTDVEGAGIEDKAVMGNRSNFLSCCFFTRKHNIHDARHVSIIQFHP